MMRISLRPYYLMGSLIAIFLLITGGAGVFNNDIYRPFLSDSIVAFQFFQDCVSTIFAPLLLLTMLLARRGSRRAFICWTGILVYVIYYYAFYAFGLVLTAYFPLYLALMGLSVFSLIGLLTGVDLGAFRAHVAARMPVRLIALVLGSTIMFVPIWLVMMFENIPTEQAQETALVFVLDLPLLIPACLFAAWHIWRRRELGYLLSGPLLFKAAVSGILLTGGELLKLARGLMPAFDQLSMYLFLAVIGLTALSGYLRNLEDDEHEVQAADWGQAKPLQSR